MVKRGKRSDSKSLINERHEPLHIIYYELQYFINSAGWNDILSIIYIFH